MSSVRTHKCCVIYGHRSKLNKTHVFARACAIRHGWVCVVGYTFFSPGFVDERTHAWPVRHAMTPYLLSKHAFCPGQSRCVAFEHIHSRKSDYILVLVLSHWRYLPHTPAAAHVSAFCMNIMCVFVGVCVDAYTRYTMVILNRAHGKYYAH